MAKIEYVILRVGPDMDDFVLAGSALANNPDQAIRMLDQPGTYVAVPGRNWNVRTLEVQTTETRKVLK